MSLQTKKSDCRQNIWSGDSHRKNVAVVTWPKLPKISPACLKEDLFKIQLKKLQVLLQKKCLLSSQNLIDLKTSFMCSNKVLHIPDNISCWHRHTTAVL